MSQRPVNLSSKAFSRNAMLIEDHAPAIYAGRQILYSVKNTDRLATESNRARQVFQTNQKCSRDFAAYFQSSPKSGDPNYVASHTSPEPVTIRKVVPTFTMAQSLRWNPYVETSSIEDVSHAERGPYLNCKCANCSTRNCPSRMSSSSTLRSSSLRNNIMRFADIYTMTPKLADAGCGSSVVPSTRISEASASGSDIAVRDTRACIHIDRLSNHRRCQPVPILKNSRRHCNDDGTAGSNCSERCSSSQRYEEAERDDYNCEPSRVSSIRSFFRCRKKKKERNDVGCQDKNRRIIYNEGISDHIADRCPVMPMAVPLETGEWRHNSKTCMKNKTQLPYCDEEENQIPHSQMVNSRYHKNCKARSKFYFYDNDQVCHIIPPSPKIRPRKTTCSKPVNLYHPPPPIRLPKKVLTSEMNIDTYVDSNCQQRIGPFACNRRNW